MAKKPGALDTSPRSGINYSSELSCLNHLTNLGSKIFVFCMKMEAHIAGPWWPGGVSEAFENAVEGHISSLQKYIQYCNVMFGKQKVHHSINKIMETETQKSLLGW